MKPREQETEKDYDRRTANRHRHEIAGWSLFIGCALLYAAAGLKNQDILGFLGSMVFLIACVVFLVPLLRK